MSLANTFPIPQAAVRPQPLAGKPGRRRGLRSWLRRLQRLYGHVGMLGVLR